MASISHKGPWTFNWGVFYTAIGSCMSVVARSENNKNVLMLPIPGKNNKKQIQI